MQFGKFGKLTFALASICIAAPAMAGELDHAASAPQGIIVRVDASGSREVFKADTAKVSSDEAAAEAANLFVTEANRVAQIAPANELDRTASSEAWYYWYAPSYYGNYYYTYYSYGYSWSYYPCYRWTWGGYNYYYYSWY